MIGVHCEQADDSLELTVALRAPGCKVAQLDLSNNLLGTARRGSPTKFTARLAAVLRLDALTTLLLGRCGLSSEGVGSLMRALCEVVAVVPRASKLEVLDLRGNRIEGTKELGTYIQRSALVTLALGGNLISDHGVEQLATALKSSAIVGLDLSSNAFSTRGMAALKPVLASSSVGQLTRCDLSGNGKDIDVEALLPASERGCDIGRADWDAIIAEAWAGS